MRTRGPRFGAVLGREWEGLPEPRRSPNPLVAPFRPRWQSLESAGGDLESAGGALESAGWCHAGSLVLRKLVSRCSSQATGRIPDGSLRCWRRGKVRTCRGRPSRRSALTVGNAGERRFTEGQCWRWRGRGRDPGLLDIRLVAPPLRVRGFDPAGNERESRFRVRDAHERPDQGDWQGEFASKGGDGDTSGRG
jgi:hypothetical protein